MTLEQMIAIGVLLLLGGVLQSAVGFGLGLFAIPLMVWAGIPLPQTIMIVLLNSMAQASWGCYRHHEHLQWRDATEIALLRIATLPLGVWLLTLLVTVGPERIKQVIGIALLGVLALQSLFRVQPRQRIGWGWTLAAGTSSGVLAGMTGMGGPPIVLWVMAHDWPSHRARTFLWSTFLMTMPVTLGLLIYEFHWPVIRAAEIGLIFMPVTVAGSTLGLWLGGRMSRRRLRAAMMAMLVFVALASVAAPIWHGI